MDIADLRRLLKLGIYPALTAFVGILIVILINKFTEFSIEFVQFLVYLNLAAILLDFGLNETLQYTHRDLRISLVNRAHLLRALSIRSVIFSLLVLFITSLKFDIFEKCSFAHLLYLIGAIFNFDSFALTRKSILKVSNAFILLKIMHLLSMILAIRLNLSLDNLLVIHSLFFLLSNLIVFSSLVTCDSNVSNRRFKVSHIVRFGFSRIFSSFSLSSATLFLDIYGFKHLISDFYLLDKIRVGLQGIISGVWSVQRNREYRIHRLKEIIIELGYIVLLYFGTGILLLAYLHELSTYVMILIILTIVFLLAMLNVVLSNNLLFYSSNVSLKYFKIIGLQSLLYLMAVVLLVPIFSVWGMLLSLAVFEIVFLLFVFWSIPNEDLRDFFV